MKCEDRFDYTAVPALWINCVCGAGCNGFTVLEDAFGN